MANDSGLPIMNSYLDRENYKNYVAVGTIASATTTDLESSDSQYCIVSGTTSITGIVLAEGHRRIVRFSGALTLTHGASLILPAAADITTVAGDVAEFVGEASGVVRCISYVPTSVSPVDRLAEIVTATNVITAAENGKTFFLNAAAGFASTLPAPALGLKFKFVVHTATSSNGYTIGTNSGANVMYGMMVERAGTAGVAGSAEDLITFVNGQMVKGDWIIFESDGTSWYYYGMTDVAAGSTATVT